MYCLKSLAPASRTCVSPAAAMRVVPSAVQASVSTAPARCTAALKSPSGLLGFAAATAQPPSVSSEVSALPNVAFMVLITTSEKMTSPNMASVRPVRPRFASG